MFYRYKHDGYGETEGGGPFTGADVGRLWPILNGERGEYELLVGHAASAIEQLKTMGKAANEGFMLPEQVWDRPDGNGRFVFGQGTDSATPLAWSMAQFVRLALSIDAGKPVETPSVVAERYRGGDSRSFTFSVTVPDSTAGTGRPVFLAGGLNKLDPPLASWNPAGLRMNQVDPTQWTVTVSGAAGTNIQYKYVLGDWAFVEKSQSCAEIPNRSVTLSSGGQVHSDSVQQWRNVSPCGN